MKMLIGGNLVDRKEKIEVLNPQDNSVLDTVPSAEIEDVEKAYKSAEIGAERMAQLSTYEKYKILNKTSVLLEERKEEFSKTIALEGVKTIREARAEVKRAIDGLAYAAEETKRVGGEVLRMDGDYRESSKLGYWIREPVGIVLAITAYNDPLNLVIHKTAPAIAAGNAVVVKPTYLTPLSAINLGKLYLEAGLPEESISVITGRSARVGDPLVTDDRPGVISFTGGVNAGEKIARKAGLKRVLMELGSSSAVIVLEDAELNDAVESIVSGSFWAAGQDCIGVQRLYIKEDIYAKFRDLFIERIEKYRIGDKMDENTDMGPMITPGEAERIKRWIDEALDSGAELLVGGKKEGNYVWPTVLEKPDRKSKVVRREVFGPVVSIFPVENLEEGIKESNDSDYGLHAAIFTKDIDRALHAAEKLKFGGVMINDSTDFRVDYMPFGGFRKSGMGREGFRFAIEEMSEIKMVTISRKENLNESQG